MPGPVNSERLIVQIPPCVSTAWSTPCPVVAFLFALRWARERGYVVAAPLVVLDPAVLAK